MREKDFKETDYVWEHAAVWAAVEYIHVVRMPKGRVDAFKDRFAAHLMDWKDHPPQNQLAKILSALHRKPENKELAGFTASALVQDPLVFAEPWHFVEAWKRLPAS